MKPCTSILNSAGISRRNLLAGAGLGAAALSLAACGSGSTEAAGSAAGSGDGSEVTIEFMHSSVEQERLDVITELVEKFESENPGIKVKQTPVEEDAFNTKVVTLARSDELPNVIEVSQDFAKVMETDELIDKDAITEVIQSVGEDSYFEGAKRLVRSEDGTAYVACPISGWVQGIWYSKSKLSEAGFEEPSTWEDIQAVAEHFNDPDNKQYGIALATAEDTFAEQTFSQFALSNGANIFDADGNITVDTPEMEEALEFYKTLAGYTMPGSNATTEVKDAYMNGSAPMAMYSTYLLPSIYEEGMAEDVGFAIPTKTQEAVYGTVSGLTISAGQDEAELEATKKFIQFLSEAENLTTWTLMSPGGAQPISPLVSESEAYTSNEVVSAFGDLFTEVAEAFDKIQIFGLVGEKNFSAMGNVTSSGAIPKAVNEVTVGGVEVSDAIAEAAQTLSEL